MRVESTWKPLLETGAKPVLVGVTASGRLDGSVGIGKDGLNPERLSKRKSEIRRALHHLGIAGNPTRDLTGLPAEQLQGYVAQIQKAVQLAEAGNDQGMSMALISAREFARSNGIRVHERRLDDIAAGGYRASYETSLRNLAKAQYAEHVDRFLEGARRCVTAGRIKSEPEALAAAENAGYRSAYQAALTRASTHAGQTSASDYYSKEMKRELDAAQAIAARGGFAPNQETVRGILSKRVTTEHGELLKARERILSPSGEYLFISNTYLPKYKEHLQNLADLAKTEGNIPFQGSNFDFARYCQLEVAEIFQLFDTRIIYPSKYEMGKNLRTLLDLAQFVAEKGGISMIDAVREKAHSSLKAALQTAALDKKNFSYSDQPAQEAAQEIAAIRHYAAAYGIDAEEDIRAALKPVCADFLKKARKRAMNGGYGSDNALRKELDAAQKFAHLGGLDIARHVQEIEALKSFWRRRLHVFSDLFDWNGNPNWPK